VDVELSFLPSSLRFLRSKSFRACFFAVRNPFGMVSRATCLHGSDDCLPCFACSLPVGTPERGGKRHLPVKKKQSGKHDRNRVLSLCARLCSCATVFSVRFSRSTHSSGVSFRERKNPPTVPLVLLPHSTHLREGTTVPPVRRSISVVRSVVRTVLRSVVPFGGWSCSRRKTK
jgi:hypothetical protein